MDFVTGKWNKEINVRDFIVRNYTPYDGDDSFWLDQPKNKRPLARSNRFNEKKSGKPAAYWILTKNNLRY